jgi:lipid II:glycine glycyltransferase (peptidoglycan interpeptide bridge formation enzyme)
VTDPRRWSSLVDASPTPYFSQLWEWGEVQRAIGWEPSRLELVRAETDGGACIAAAQLLVRRLPGIGWGIGHAPRGPVLGRAAEDWARFEVALVRWARANRVATLVFDPDVSSESDLAKALMRPPWRAAPMVSEPRCHVVDVLPEADLWANVHRKHREWIRRAERADIDVRWTDSRASAGDAGLAIRQFQQVYAEIAKRIGVALMSPDYYELMWDLFRKEGRAHMVTATAQGTPLGAMLHFTCADEMIWFAGGQTPDGARVGVGKLLVWRSMLRARELGARRYNMWGTATEGLAHFKLGFGAREEAYIGTRSMAVIPVVDLPLRAVWQARESLRRLGRR